MSFDAPIKWGHVSFQTHNPLLLPYNSSISWYPVCILTLGVDGVRVNILAGVMRALSLLFWMTGDICASYANIICPSTWNRTRRKKWPIAELQKFPLEIQVVRSEFYRYFLFFQCSASVEVPMCSWKMTALFRTDPMGFVAEGILSASQRWQSSIFPRWWCLAPKTQTRGCISCLMKSPSCGLSLSLSLSTNPIFSVV